MSDPGAALFAVFGMLAMVIAGLRLLGSRPPSGQGCFTACALVLLSLPAALGVWGVLQANAWLHPDRNQDPDLDRLWAGGAPTSVAVLLLAAAVVLLLDPGPSDSSTELDEGDEMEGFRGPRRDGDAKPERRDDSARHRADRQFPR